MVDSYYIIGYHNLTPNVLEICLNNNGQKEGNISISTTQEGDKTVSLHSAQINGTISSKILFKRGDDNNVNADHVGLITGEDDGKTFEFICDVISNVDVFAYNGSDFTSHYSGHKTVV